MESTSAEQDRVAALRALLPATRAGIFLNTGTCGPLPVPAAAAMAEVAARELAIGRSTRAAYEELLDGMAEARAAAAAILGAGLEEVAITHSTTAGLNLAVGAVRWREGDRAITTTLEHRGLLGPLETARARHGIEVLEVDIGDGGDDDRTLTALGTALAAGGVRLVALSHVAWSTGAVLPIAEVGRAAHEHGALIAIDGAQAAGAIPVGFDESEVDFYATSGQKWLLGPEGTGALAVRAGLAGALHGPVSGYFSYLSPSPDGKLHEWPDARRFESAGYARAPLAGFARSAGWLAMEVGLPWAHGRATGLAREAADRLAAIGGVELVTPRRQMASLVSFRVPGWPAERVVEELGRRIQAYPRAVPGLEVVRLSVAFFTTRQELDRVLREVAVIAAHPPGTLPPRPAIQFLDATDE